MSEAVEPPDWLPDGWIMEVRKGKMGRVYRNENEVKHSPVWPRGWVVELRVRKVGGKDEEKYKRYIHRSTGSIFYSKEEVLQFLEVENICDNLISTYNGYLKTENYKTESNDLVCIFLKLLSYHELNILLPSYLMDGLRKSNSEGTQKAKRNLGRTQGMISLLQYYTDPQSGYVFRTCKDCFLFHEHGVLSRYAFKPRRNNVYGMLGFEGPSTLHNLRLE
ncbi:hypothetical protein ZIOFF_023930 [Zingiber officinale]|uniref:MBD domain-containing protein n=1 Tax=Zingiber officinale TaxID=94328 RepID=A0A8J5GXH9_ZINOF|nr:hypothetical protein ZIOFF_023930 [Zingiber officinale]